MWGVDDGGGACNSCSEMGLNGFMKLTALLAGALVAFALSASAESPEVKKDDIHELLERAQKAKAEGRYEEAKELAEQLRQRQGFEKRDRKPDGEKPEQLSHMKAQIDELHRAGKHEEAEQLKRKFQGEFMARHHDGKHPASPQAERLEHLMEAVKHLRAAKINEPAEQLERMADKMREDLEAQKRAEAGHPMKHHDGRMPGEAAGQLQAIREQLEKTNRKIEELDARLRKLQPAPAEAPKP